MERSNQELYINVDVRGEPACTPAGELRVGNAEVASNAAVPLSHILSANSHQNVAQHR